MPSSLAISAAFSIVSAPRQRSDAAPSTGAFAVASLGDWEGLPTREALSLLDTEAGATLR